MGWYEIAKVVHFLGLIALFGFFVICARAGAKLRQAASVGEARTWIGMLEATRGMVPGAAVMFLASGFTMAGLRWRGPFPFVTVGLLSILIIWMLWGLVGARHLKAMRAAATAGADADPIGGALAAVVLDPARWGTLGALNGAALGVLFVMTTKPGWPASVTVVLVLATIVGAVYASGVRRQRAHRVARARGATTR